MLKNFLINFVNNEKYLIFRRWLLNNIFIHFLKLFGCGYKKRKSILYVGQAYYNSWYLSRALKDIGWKAELLNWDSNPKNQIYYHGHDYYFDNTYGNLINYILFYLRALQKYDIFHFANKNGLSFGPLLDTFFNSFLGKNSVIIVLKLLNKKIVYSNNGCNDGVSKTSFSKLQPISACYSCSWFNNEDICSDELNLNWGKFRNEVCDYQINLGGNRADYNIHPKIHEVPLFYCLDPKIWNPKIKIPSKYQFREKNSKKIYLYHGIGNKLSRTNNNGVNIKSSHIYYPIIDNLISKGYDIEVISPHDVPNIDIRFIQIQCDIYLDMLTYGWFGATARECMMLGIPVICYIRKEWRDNVKKELPDFVNELPVINANPENVEIILEELIINREKRIELGIKSREFALKWHDSKKAAIFFDNLYSNLLDEK